MSLRGKFLFLIIWIVHSLLILCGFAIVHFMWYAGWQTISLVLAVINTICAMGVPLLFGENILEILERIK